MDSIREYPGDIPCLSHKIQAPTYISLRLLQSYSVFGRVVKGMEVVQQIAKVEVDDKDKPIEDVRIVNCGELIKKSAAGGAVTGEYM